jgi:hypothetical protein
VAGLRSRLILGHSDVNIDVVWDTVRGSRREDSWRVVEMAFRAAPMVTDGNWSSRRVMERALHLNTAGH